MLPETASDVVGDLLDSAGWIDRKCNSVGIIDDGVIDKQVFASTKWNDPSVYLLSVKGKGRSLQARAP